jgi:peptidoglycan/LPS O-acetylase OafA/YrhL
LCYEEQFYAIVGLALILARRFFFSALTLITVLVFAGVIFLPALGVRTEGLFYDGYWLMFAAGILVYYVLNYAPRKTLVWFCVPIILGGLYAVAEPRRLLKPEVGEPGQTYLSAFLFALLIIGLHRWDQSVSRSKWLRPFGYCGEMCYSLYLVHWPTVSIVSWAFNRCGIRNPAAVFCFGLPLCVAAAVALARLFHILIERRFLNPNPMKSKITVVEVSRENREGGEGSRKHF